MLKLLCTESGLELSLLDQFHEDKCIARDNITALEVIGSTICACNEYNYLFSI